MKNIIFLLFLSFILIINSCVLRCDNKNRIISSTDSIKVIEGIGFLNLQVDNITKDTILKYFGTSFKEINHNNYSIEIRYDNLGISFYYLYKTKPEKIFTIVFFSNFKGRTKKGFSINSMTLNDVLRIYGNPNWRTDDLYNEIILCYDDLGIEFSIDRKTKISDTIPTTYAINDVYINRMLLRYFRTVYGNERIKEITISAPSQFSHSKRPYIGNSEIDSIFQVNISKSPISLLNNRLIINIPEGAKVNDRDSSSVVYEKCKQSFTISLTDYHCMASNNMNAVIRKLIKTWDTKDLKFKLKDSLIKKNISIYIIEPSTIKLNEDRFLLNCAFIKNLDNSILYISFYINTNAWYNLMNYQNLSKEIIKSIKSGDKSLNVKPELIKINTQEKEIVISKPKGIIYTINNGPDFRTYNFEKLVRFGELQSNMLIYIGNYPNYLYKQNNNSAVLVKKSGLLFGQKVEWNYCYTKKYKFPYTLEGICRFDKDHDIHVALTICSIEDALLFKKALPNTVFNDEKK